MQLHKYLSRAINKAMGKVGSESPLTSEKTLAKYLDYQFVKGGCDKQAYIPVIASGPNALTIHYTRNDDLLYKDELVFIDAGGKVREAIARIFREHGQIHQVDSVNHKEISMKLF